MQDKIDKILEGMLPEGIDERVKDSFNAAFGAQLAALGGFSNPAWSMVFIEKLCSVSDGDSLREFERFLGRAVFVAETEDELIDEDGCYMYLELARMLAGTYEPGQFDKYFPGLKGMEGGRQAVSAYIRLRSLEINQAMVEAHGSRDVEKARIESTYVLEDSGWLARKVERDEIDKLEGELRQAFGIPQGWAHEALPPVRARLEENRRRSEAAKQAKIEAYPLKKVLGQKLCQAVKDDDELEAVRLIKAGADLNVKNEQDDTALICAAVNDHTVIAEALIKAGADLNLKGKYGNTALIMAAYYGYTAIAEALIKAGADLYLKGLNRRTALIWAASYGHTAIAKALIKAGAGLNVKGMDRRTALIWTAIRGHTAIAEALIKVGAGLNVKDKDGRTALIWAAYNGRTAIAEALINAGANLNVKDNSNQTPLIYAIRGGEIDIAIALLKAGADPFIDPASDAAIPQLEQFRENYIGTIINAHGAEALPSLACSENNSETSVRLFLKYAVANGRADLIYQALTRYKEITANLQNALRDETIATAVIRCVVKDTVNDKNNNLFVLKFIAHANDIETYTLEDIFELRYGNLFWDTFKDTLIKAIKTLKEKNANIAKFIKGLDKDSLAKLVKQVKDLKEDKAFLSRFGLGKQELLNELLKKSIELSNFKSFTSLLSQGAELNLMLSSDQLLLEATWSKYISMRIASEMVPDKHPDFTSARSILYKTLAAKETNINIRGIGGQSILHAAASQGTASDIALLMLRGANPNVLDNKDINPTFYTKKDSDKLRVFNMTKEQILADNVIMEQVFNNFSVAELIIILKASGMRPSELVRHEESLVAMKAAIDKKPAQPLAAEAPMSLDPTERAAPAASDGYTQDLARLVATLNPTAKAHFEKAKLSSSSASVEHRSEELHNLQQSIEHLIETGTESSQVRPLLRQLDDIRAKYHIPLMEMTR